ncbi:hypothetical protein TNCV_4681001 [Trichonephila clavipes]|nr:hypothetical protein TNCV_4681001 [Trichonephila clavipes]
MITSFFIPELNNHDVQELWFQQDGATCHTARATIDLLKDTFGDRLISRFGPVNWPPRSCDLTPLDYFLWGYVKSLVYADKPQTLDHLEDNIRRVIADIRPQMLEKVIENWTSRLDYIQASRGSHMPEIIFKMNDKLSRPCLPRDFNPGPVAWKRDILQLSHQVSLATFHIILLRRSGIQQQYCRTHNLLQVPIAELAERWTELPQVSDESRSFFRVHTGYFSNIPKCIKAEFIASWGCSQSSVVSSSQP